MKRALRVSADTSVFGGCFDEEFMAESVRFFDEVRQGRFVLVVSDVTLDELELAPEVVRGVLAGLPSAQVELVATSVESEGLRTAYLDAGVVGPASSNDASHIAVATVSNVDLVVSWNFRHIVHFVKIGGYEGVNSLRGYRSPRIYSLREVVTLWTRKRDSTASR
ncbi:MAG TPA: hypothetical protein VHW09_03195 [Bryobacteraceae bacterium]|nr:hypothetical protein [Bryobacteraceae bacterium]